MCYCPVILFGCWPVRYFNTLLTGMIQYADASRHLDAKAGLRLAIHYHSVHREYQELAKEIEGSIYANIGATGVPS
jgi:hypothetical protein